MRTDRLIAVFPALFVGLFLSTVLSSCEQSGGAETTGERERMTVVATTGMIADVARNIAGERAEVIALIGPGIDPHLYTPTRSDLDTLRGADILLLNGNHLEGKMDSAFERARESGIAVYRVTEEIDPALLLPGDESEGEGGVHDPHVWMDPSRWLAVAEVIEQKLIEHDPDGRTQYETNADRYETHLTGLIDSAEYAMASIPKESRVLVSAHDAFRYFGDRFDCEVVGIQGLSTESEAGVRDIERLVDLLVDRRVRAVFVESTVSERNIRALIDGAKARGHEVVIGGELFSDAMGPEDTEEGTYLGMIDHNVTTIVRALGGELPEGGLRGAPAPE